MMDDVLASTKNPNVLAGGQRDIRSKLSMAHLPAMPQIMLRLLDLCQQDDLNMSDLTLLISRDAGMVARIFSVASSVAYQRRNRPTTLDQCLSMLGMSMIKTIVINESVMQAFNRFTVLRDIDPNRFWEHALRSALIARELARTKNEVHPDEAYLGGLLHDIGRLALLISAPESYKSIFHEYPDNEALCAAEQRLFGLNHAEVGAWLIEKWALDSFLGDSLLYHHEPIERLVSAPPLVRVVSLANHLASRRNVEAETADLSMLAMCGYALDKPVELLERAERELQKVVEFFGIKISKTHQSIPQQGAASTEPNLEDAQFASRIQDILLVNQVLGDSLKVEGFESSMEAISLAMKILFNLDVALCFERVEGRSETFKARPLGLRCARFSALEFVRGRSASLLAKSLDSGPQVILCEQTGLQVLDDQIIRAVGGAGILLLPLRTLSSCVGLMVAEIPHAGQAVDLREKLAGLAHFGRLSAEKLLGMNNKPPVSALYPVAPVPDAEGVKRVNSLIHELSNPLAIISNYLTILEAENQNKGLSQPELNIVREEVDRLSKMLRVARNQQNGGVHNELNPVDANRVIEDLVTLFRGSIPATSLLDIQLSLGEGLPEIMTDRDKLKQLLVNLIKNALEAMPQGGRINISTSPWRGNESGLSHVEICIEDNGPGLPKDVLTSLYQQVASPKGGDHQGLGLAISGQLVHALSGLINCRSGNNGTHFQILLPITRT